jgi:hypothetical protein
VSREHKLQVVAKVQSGFEIGDLVTRRSGSMASPAQIRSIFVTSRGKPMVVLEYPSQLFRVARLQQIRKV